MKVPNLSEHQWLYLKKHDVAYVLDTSSYMNGSRAEYFKASDSIEKLYQAALEYDLERFRLWRVEPHNTAMWSYGEYSLFGNAAPSELYNSNGKLKATVQAAAIALIENDLKPHPYAPLQMNNFTTTTYLDRAKNIDFSQLPEAIQKTHGITMKASENNWAMYHKSDAIKRMVDLHFSSLPNYLPKQEKPAQDRIMVVKPAIKPTLVVAASSLMFKSLADFKRLPKGTELVWVWHGRDGDRQESRIVEKPQSKNVGFKTPKGTVSWLEYPAVTDLEFPKPGKMVVKEKGQPIMTYYIPSVLEQEKQQKPTKAKKEAAPKAKKAKQPKYKAPVAYHDHFTEAETVIKSFMNMNGQTKTKKQLRALLDKTNKYIVERKIRKTDTNAEAVLLVRSSLEKAYHALKDSGDSSKIEIDLSNKTLSVLHKFVKQSKVYPTVSLLKRFVPMMNTSPDKSKAKNLKADIDSAIKNGGISKTDTYYKELSFAVYALDKYISGESGFVARATPELSGLGSLAGLGCPGKKDADCGCSKTNLAGVKKKSPKRSKKKQV